MKKYPDCFPDDFEKHILPKGAELQNKKVYRIIKSGEISRDSFISTYEEVQRGLRPMPKRGMDLRDPGTYSTSCHMEYEDACLLKNVFMRHHPAALIAEGVTEKSCGPSQLTSERETGKKDSHVDWWIYENSSPQNHFQEVKSDEK